MPPRFFFVLSGFGSFCYLKTEKSELKRMVSLGDGRTAKMYDYLAPIAGFDYKFTTCKTFEMALAKVKKQIDEGFPCVLGALDMFYLPYYAKLYHNAHIPFHYALMVGYDDEKQCVFVNDCGRSEPQISSYEELKLAWDCSYPGLSKPNTFCQIRFNRVVDKYSMAKTAFARRAEEFLNPKVSFVGYKGFEKFILDLPKWRTELNKEEYDKIFYNMVQFLGTVPTVPNALLGIDEPDSLPFYGGFDAVSTVLESIGEEFNDKEMMCASKIFVKGKEVIPIIKETIVDYLSGKDDRMNELPELFTEICNIMKDGFAVHEAFCQVLF